jgi:hypothetical protein
VRDTLDNFVQFAVEQRNCDQGRLLEPDVPWLAHSFHSASVERGGSIVIDNVREDKISDTSFAVASTSFDVSSRSGQLTPTLRFLCVLWMGSRSRTRNLACWLLLLELRDQPPQTLGDAMVLGHHVWIRCAGCSHSAVILPAVLAKLVGYDCPLDKLARRMKCQQCGEKRVRVRAVEPGER